MATRNWRSAFRIGVLSISPYLAWTLVLRIALQNWSFQAPNAQFDLVPFGGLAHAAEAIPFVIFLLIIPGAICSVFALQALSDVYALATLCSFALLVFLPTLSYGGDAVFRLSTPLVLSGSLLFARLRHRTLQALFAAVWSSTAVIALLLAISP
ncbi:MAG: hypothetical protein M1570_11615 [Chloroflexi bacterium]|nr:hypothetical protein [Chloroflexota bacterium]